jgi:hypothetical protein
MLVRASALLAFALIAGCAVSPQQLCAPYVPDTWQYLGRAKQLATQLDADLPHVPYMTNEGKVVGSLQHVWFRGGEDQLLACTLARGAMNDCSVTTTAFQRIEKVWVKGRENAVLCNVLTAPRDGSVEHTRAQ